MLDIESLSAGLAVGLQKDAEFLAALSTARTVEIYRTDYRNRKNPVVQIFNHGVLLGLNGDSHLVIPIEKLRLLLAVTDENILAYLQTKIVYWAWESDRRCSNGWHPSIRTHELGAEKYCEDCELSWSALAPPPKADLMFVELGNTPTSIVPHPTIRPGSV